MTPKQTRQALEQSLQAQNPAEFKRMKATRRLDPFLENPMAEYEQSVDAGRQSVMNALATKDSPDKAQEVNSRFAELERETLNQASERIAATTAASQSS